MAVSLDAKVILDGTTYEGLIRDVSECGLGYLMTSLNGTVNDFTPEKTIMLIFKTSSGETLNLNCEVKWFLKSSPSDDKLTLGMKVSELNAEYEEYVKTLLRNN